ncbi:peptidase M23 [Amylibacter marinus]|uniref:Peptidase M23 n=1 Tax=Amylibacter marinus TaxID=1475483 RepID=A0ABQ5VU93_9RHOB|nr:peptidoglycan DD-metalloendopeptidase family protein [Amylibacter marinus]GLQ34742.1 peptidase M23 [Amylibacter marinus]
MSLKVQNFPKMVLLSGFVGFGLSACDPDFTLNDIGDLVDRPPAIEGSGADQRPAADANGVITYPDYQVAVALRDETVSDVATRVGISADTLARHNGLKADAPLRKGEILAIPDGASLSSGSFEDIASSALDSADDTSPNVQSGQAPVRHTVRSGETAFTIARLYGVSVTSLASWNGLDRELSVRTGQRLLIPTGATPPQSQPPKPGTGTVAPTPPSASKPLPKATPKPATPAPAPKTSKLSKPVNGKVLRGFSNKSGGNEGIDYAAATGTAVTAAGDGTVALISGSVGDTTIVLIRHANNIYTVYSNVTNVTLTKGKKVKRGEPIGIVAGGNPPFVHFEVRKGTQAVDPAPYL